MKFTDCSCLQLGLVYSEENLVASHVSPNTVKSHKIVVKSLFQSHGEQLESLEGFSIVVPSHTAKVRTNCDPQASHKSKYCMYGRDQNLSSYTQII